jgi:glycosyltransferase involved in cell wall biosynthesis
MSIGHTLYCNLLHFSTKSIMVLHYPFWSVMIPTYNPKPHYLERTFKSVLSQYAGVGKMHIEVVDDCSPDVDAEKMVRSLAGDRVHFSQTPENMGLAGCWNTCIARARGEWVHILHQDDYVLTGFYDEIERLARSIPHMGLIAVRSFFVDEKGVITGMTPRLQPLEKGSRNVESFFYGSPIQCPGVTVRRNAYENHGGFSSDLCYTLDWEMWTRIIGREGGVVSPQILACYRMSRENTSNRLARTGETLVDISRLHKLFTERYRDFNPNKANRRVCEFALEQAWLFSTLNDREAEQANLRYWRRHAPLYAKAKRYGRKIYGRLGDVYSRFRD